MKPQQTALPEKEKDQTRTILVIGMVILMLQMIFHLTVRAHSQPVVQVSDSLQVELLGQLNSQQLLKRLNFPNTVKRFYTLNGNQPNWLKSEQHIGPMASAMLLLDCVRQYGLQHENYHPEILSYTLMHDISTLKYNIAAAQKIEFELMLTDAMVSMINHLHYGRFNPKLIDATIDQSPSRDLKAEEFLLKVANDPNIMDSILTVQPKLKQYQQLQGYLKLIVGQYACDAYETPEPEIREIVLNMERLRWIDSGHHVYLQVNIPSYQLSYVNQDLTSVYKIIVGKPSTPTPTLQSNIYAIETAPDWRIPHNIFVKELLPRAEKDPDYFENNHIAIYDEKNNFVAVTKASIIAIRNNPKKFYARQTSGCDNALGKVVFRFSNSHDIYLHDTPEQQYFSRTKRALSHGCIRVENAESLALRLWADDKRHSSIATLKNALSMYKKHKFLLQTPIPILITYVTITVEDGLLVRHEDIYQLDKVLESKIYGNRSQSTNINLKK
ncbi:L,D-transpeptidase scaffold domain-containing protein [Pedobacter insulae]|uniref:L,D-transpeptidase catalytic domain n=1 Tax=Pedobacter insulae TaxID=414048 RepID=A0A1I3A1T0_9SPHI|nr:L,D-transpeptidase family protein [Pedobacter insulae]SFH43958.1 L,D-transpeptidase catalytic domain [Pedobacter insulae]